MAATTLPKIVKLTISPGGSLPSASINTSDSVFWFNNTTENHQPVYTPSGGSPVNWGVPPSPLPPQKESSQVVFSTPGTYVYKCTLHTTETGTITVTDPTNPPS
jgi:plastocyanin